MRETKFRGKRKDIDWKYGYLTIIEKTHEPNVIAIKPLDEQWITYGVDPESVGEYTGLKDKNGKEIYEGDVVQYMLCGSIPLSLQRGVVSFGEFDIKDDGIPLPYLGWFVKDEYEKQVEAGLSFGTESWEVIGNIYENPELLEKAEPKL